MKTSENIGLYIHIPFCKSKCPYCDFHSHTGTEEIMDKYLAALTDEILTKRRAADFLRTAIPYVNTVYIGGGTPSYFGGERIKKVIDSIKNGFNIAANAEITVEANPNSATDSFFDSVLNAGVNRISMGVQSAADNERRILGRISDSCQTAEAVKKARAAGCKNISLDLMCGIPLQTIDSLKNSIDFCASLGVEHISSYMLKIEENTPFYRMREKLQLPDEDTQCEMYFTLVNTLEKYGYMQYEISNFSKKGYESRHNLNYWNCGNYLGIGAAAHSFIGEKRFYYPADTLMFINGGSAVFDSNGGTAEEFIMLALRLKEGLVYKKYENFFGEPFPADIIERAKKRIPETYLHFTDKGFSLTKEGFLLSNTVIGEILFF